MAPRATRTLVLSDTHAYHYREIHPDIIKAAEEADFILHLGDFDNMETYEYFKQTGKFCGVAGNHDTRELRKKLPRQDIVEISGLKIGLTHGCIIPYRSPKKMRDRFRGEKLDIIVYGHTHIIRKESIEGIFYFNPGAVSGKWPAPWNSYGILTIGETVEAETFAIIEPSRLRCEDYQQMVERREVVVTRLCGRLREPDYFPLEYYIPDRVIPGDSISNLRDAR